MTYERKSGGSSKAGVHARKARVRCRSGNGRRRRGAMHGGNRHSFSRRSEIETSLRNIAAACTPCANQPTRPRASGRLHACGSETRDDSLRRQSASSRRAERALSSASSPAVGQLIPSRSSVAVSAAKGGVRGSARQAQRRDREAAGASASKRAEAANPTRLPSETA